MTPVPMVFHQSIHAEAWDGDERDLLRSVILKHIAEDATRYAVDAGGTFLPDTLTLVGEGRHWVQPEDDDGNPDGEPFEMVDLRFTMSAEGPDGWAPTGSWPVTERVC